STTTSPPPHCEREHAAHAWPSSECPHSAARDREAKRGRLVVVREWASSRGRDYSEAAHRLWRETSQASDHDPEKVEIIFFIDFYWSVTRVAADETDAASVKL